MIFENVFSPSIFHVMIFSFIIGILGFLLVGIVLWKINPHLTRFKKPKLGPAILSFGVATTFFLTIVVCTLTPSLITVENDLSYSESFSFRSNNVFLGIGGSYIANNSNKTLKLVGIGADKDINVIIPPKSIKKVRRCPQVYFKEVPSHQSIRITRSARGRRRVISGPSVYLIKY